MNTAKSLSHVLIVEDNPGDFALVDDFLSEKFEGLHITHAETFTEAQKHLKQGKENYDLVLLDLSLPDKTGEELLTEITALCGSIPVIVLTGYSDFSFGIKSLSLGSADYILKDELTPMMLYKSIMYALERKKAMHALAESEKKYSELFHLSPLPMFVFAVDNLAILNVNKSAIKHYGYTRDEFLSMTIEDIYPAGELPTLEEDVITSKNNKLELPGPYCHRKKNGDIIQVEIQGNSVSYRGIEAKVVLIINITERLNYIREIELQNERLREISWIQSHMVRAPLARLLGLVSLIRDMKDNNSELQHMMNYLELSANELDQVVREITSKTVMPEVDPLLKEAI
jgi:PAS domain S-box-containing protein